MKSSSAHTTDALWQMGPDGTCTYPATHTTEGTMSEFTHLQRCIECFEVRPCRRVERVLTGGVVGYRYECSTHTTEAVMCQSCKELSVVGIRCNAHRVESTSTRLIREATAQGFTLTGSVTDQAFTSLSPFLLERLGTK